MATDTACPVTGSKVTTLPKDHPSTEGAKSDVCPVTNATLSHHKDVVHKHPEVKEGATEKDCPVLAKAAEDKVCPVVGTASTALPPNHPSTENAKDGEKCPVTQATLSHHKDVVHAHPAVGKNASVKDCPVASAKPDAKVVKDLVRERDEKDGEEADTQEGQQKKKQKTENGASSCPVTGSKVSTLPANHPSTDGAKEGDKCPVTNATLEHHKDVVHEHPKVDKNASEKDCPVASKKDQTKSQKQEDGQCPVTGSKVSTLPPDHPSTDGAKAGDKCPVTNATLEHHKDVVHEHPKVDKEASKEDCPVASSE